MFNPFKRKRKPQFGELAVKKGFASEKDIQEALHAQKEYLEKHALHKKIGSILAEKGILSEDDMEVILEEQKRQNSLMAWFCVLFSLNK